LALSRIMQQPISESGDHLGGVLGVSGILGMEFQASTKFF
jgi:hypothetical protein